MTGNELQTSAMETALAAAKYVSLALLLGVHVLEHFFKGDEKNPNRGLFKKLIFVFGLIVGILALFSTWMGDKLQTRNDTARDRKMTAIQAQSKAGMELSERLIMIVTSNTAVAPAVRSEVIRASETLIRINTNFEDPDAWREEYRSKIDLAWLKREQTKELQRQEAQRAAEEDNRRRTEQEAHEEKIFVEKALPIFQYAIISLEHMVSERAKRMGEKVFIKAGDVPGKINQLSGEKSSWTYDISYSKAPPALTITCTGKDLEWPTNYYRAAGEQGVPGTSTYWAPNRGTMAEMNLAAEASGRIPPKEGLLYQITLAISCDVGADTVRSTVATRAKSAGPFPPIEEQQRSANYTNLVDSSLRTLVGAQLERAAGEATKPTREVNKR